MKRFCVFLLLLPALCWGTEFQYWQIAYFSKEISNHWLFVFQSEERWCSVYSNLVRHQNDIGLSYLFNDSWNIRYLYRHKVQATEEGWSTDPENVIDLSGSWKMGQMEIGTRQRFVIPMGENEWIYRSRVTLDYPILARCTNNKLYFFNEFFLTKLQNYDNNRCGAGWQFPLLKNSNAIRFLFAMQHTKKNSSWSHTLNIFWVESVIRY